MAFPVVTDEIVISWLLECEAIFPHGYYEFDYDSNFLQDFFVDRDLKFKLSELYYTHSVYELMNKYWDLILPLENTIDENFNSEDDESFAF